jgi:hypothetical protein
MNKRFSVLILLSLLMVSGYAAAQSMVGIITSLDGHVNIINDENREADFGGDLIYKDKMKIGPGASLVITYYAGCRQEWYGENTVIEIGQKKSRVISGRLQKTEIFDCEVPEVVLSDKDSFKKAAFHIRGIKVEKKSDNQLKNQSENKVKENKSRSYRVDANEISRNDVNLRIWTAKQNDHYYRSGEHIIIYLVADKDAYLKLDYFQTDGKVVHLVPNLFEEKSKIKAGQIYVIGGNRAKLKLIVEHPFGEETISAMVSAQPFDKRFHSKDAIQDALEYKQNLMRNMIGENKLKVAEYALDIWSLP